MRVARSTTASPPAAASITPPVVLAYVARERVRTVLRTSFPRRRGRLLLTRTAAEFAAQLRAGLVDAAVVDLGHTTSDAWATGELARDFPSVPFFAALPVRSGDTPSLGRCATLGFVGVLLDGVDDGVARDLVLPQAFTVRFAAALDAPPPSFALTTPLQRAAWRHIVGAGGRPVRTGAVATALAVTREHLSRSFASGGAPNLKRVIDLVRLIAAAELAKNPGYDVRDVAQVLGFASSSHLSNTAQRVVGTRPASLARLRTVDLIERFVNGHGRSRTPAGGADAGSEAGND